ncbi:restriction endonuclease subunit S [Vibrio alginolyticus]|nr:restriction endonuclease subunit S [Vibrio alginolyticus]
MVPKGWSDGRVGDLLSGLESGVSVNGEDRQLAHGEKGVLKVSAVSYGVFDENAAKAITSGEELKRAKTHPKKGQIIISRSNTEELVGASAYVEANFDHLYLPDKLWQTIPTSDADMKWLSYVLASEHSRYTLSNLATGTSGSMKNITKGELLGLKVGIPPLLEQRKIAKILSAWDKAIATTEKLIETSKQQKQALMQQLLTGKKRLVNPETGKAFEGEWEEATIASLFNISTGKSKSKFISEEGKFLIVDMGSISREGKLIASKKTSHEGDFLSLGQLVMPKDDIGGGQIIGRTAYIPENGQFVLSDHVYLLTPKSVNSLFATYLINSWGINKQLRSKANGTAQLGLGKKDVEKQKLVVPTLLQEQQKIASVLTAADKEIEVLEDKLAHFKQEKKALMQQLLTGKRRVKVDEMEAA